MHIHTDVIAAMFAGLSALLLFHTMRALGAFMVSKGMTGPGTLIGGLATFN